ncbi:prostacyclin receptor [Danio rerio]|uniref:Prostacyclin receptor n=1 Tax=Danio rerio TaxID=7955 RepID=E7FE45_DANRE|nr:prostacyclin receptor [Danio rerio]XP_689903.3 prostacyclin receptor [Danio rerio]|eukprot:XP_021321991.1 prostacyclin receptor [Danio rerio]
MLSNQSCENITSIEANGNPGTSTVMFIAGVVGNLIALAILGVHQKDRRTKSSVFCILVTGLALTDLLGTCLLSPPVFICYAYRTSLVGLTGDQRLCGLFAFAMTFFILASMLILCAMAVERCLAISHPYFYSKHVRRSFAKIVLLLIYLFTFVFCLMPFFGYGRHKQYCPGTWCFIKMEVEEGDDEERRSLAFSLSYAVLMALLIAIVFMCNGSVIVSLCRMHRSQLTRRGSVVSAGRKRRLSTWFGQGEEEMDHLLLLASMTLIFVICSLPLTICGFENAISPVGNDQRNLTAFRFSAFNPILDPWIFIIFRKAVFHHIRALFRCCFPREAVKTTAQSSQELKAEDIKHSSSIQSKIYHSLPQ